MNTQRLIVVMALASSLPLGAQAGSPEPTATTTVMVHCRYGQWPTRDEVARYLRIPEVTVGQAQTVIADTTGAAPSHDEQPEAGDRVRSIQQFVRKQGRHECDHGATHVQVEFVPQAGSQALALVVSRATP